MKRVIAAVIGVVLLALGVIALLGAIEVMQGGAGAEALAQGFLVPVSLFALGGFALYVGVKGWS